jgi:hypothetical protein
MVATCPLVARLVAQAAAGADEGADTSDQRQW